MTPDPETISRVVLGLIFVGAGCIGIPHRLRADRVGGPVSRRVDPRWFWILMGGAAPPLGLGCLAFLVQPRWLDFAQVEAPAWLRLLGVPAAIAALALFSWMFHHLGLNVTATSAPRAAATLVTSGPYHWVRHPMYSTVLILVVAVTLLTANALIAVSGAAMFTLLAARSRIEERRLVEKFGDAYRHYQHRTGRFVPRLLSSPAGTLPPA